MSTSNQTEKVRLEVYTKDEAAEIFVIDGQFQLADRGLGLSKTFSLNPGIYTVKVRAGMETRERHVILPKGLKEPVVERFDSIDFPSPAPLNNTAKTHEYHIEAAVTESKLIHADIGSGSHIFLFARDWTPPGNTGKGFQVTDSPHRGLTLRNKQDKVLVEFSKASKVGSFGDPSASCNIQLNPGCYRLSLELSTGRRLEQTIVASAGWQTQVFLLQRDYKSADLSQSDRLADLANASIMLSKGLGFDPSRPSVRLAEQARIGLSSTRQVLSDGVAKEVLDGKFNDPMLGIYGAHLLLLKKKIDTDLLRKVVDNLRRLLGGSSHPDVEALALLIDPKDVSYVFDVPPMLQKSWWHVVDATVARPELVPQNSLASRIANHVWGEGSWLLWLNSGKKGGWSRAYKSEEMKQLQAMVDSALQAPARRKARREKQDKNLVTGSRALLLGRTSSGASSSFANDDQATGGHESDASPPRDMAEPSTPQSLLELGEEVLKSMVQRSGIPRNSLEALLRKMKKD